MTSGNVYLNGEFIGKYEILGDFGTPFANALFYGNGGLIDQAERAKPVVEVIGEVAVSVMLFPLGLAGAGRGITSVIAARRGAEAARLLNNATQPFRQGPLTQAGRALTKHPNIIGETGNILQKLGGAANVNARAAAALENIIQMGTRTVRTTTAFGRVIEFKLPSGLGARFSKTTGEFIGFLGRGL